MERLAENIILGLLTGGLYALLGMGIVLVYKATKVVSLAHGQIVFFGAYFLWFLYSGIHLPLWLSLPLALVLTALLGLAIERITIHPLIGQPLFSVFLITIAVFMALDGVAQMILKGDIRVYQPALFPTEPIMLGSIAIAPTTLAGFAAALIVALALAAFFRRTALGLQMRITAEDHLTAQSMGIGVKRVFSLIWAISAMVTGIAGIFLASSLSIYYMLPVIGFKGLIVALFGGLESLAGALVAGLLLGVLEGLTGGYVEPLVGGGFREVSAYALLLIILLARPYGLFGLKRIERI